MLQQRNLFHHLMLNQNCSPAEFLSVLQCRVRVGSRCLAACSPPTHCVCNDGVLHQSGTLIFYNVKLHCYIAMYTFTLHPKWVVQYLKVCFPPTWSLKKWCLTALESKTQVESWLIELTWWEMHCDWNVATRSIGTSNVSTRCNWNVLTCCSNEPHQTPIDFCLVWHCNAASHYTIWFYNQ